MKARRLVAAALVALGAVAAQPQAAHAHAALVRSDPAASTTMAQPPSTVRLWFKEAVVAQATVVEVASADGAEVAGRLRAHPGQADLVVVDMPASIPHGVYVVRWRVLSAADGHVTRGVMAFGVGAGADPSTAALERPAPSTPAQDVVLRWLNFLTLAALFGPLAVALAVLGPSRWRGPASDFDAARRTAQSRLLAGAVVAIGGAAAVGVARAAWDIRSLTSGPGGSETTAGELLFDTRWGALWLSRQLTLVVAAGSLIFLRRTLRDPRSGRGVRSGAAAATVAAAVALAVIQALGGHAAGVDSAAGVAVVSDAAHLVGAATWIGGLAALASLGRLRRAEPAGMLAREAWRAFGPLAAACVAVVVVTGLYGLAREVASLDAVLTTTYGQALLGKSALFVVMGLLGLCSSIALHPVVAARVDTVLGRLGRRRPALRHVRRLVVVETALGVAILLLAALASASPPANGPEFEWVPAAVPDTRSGPAGDVLVSLSAYPNRPGENLLRVRATSTRRQAPSDIAMVLVRIASDVGGESIETVPLAAAGDGTYEGTTMALGQAGSWRAEVVVRRAGVEDATVAFDWELPVAAPRPRLISNRPWRAQLEMVVVALLVAQATTAVLFVRRTRPRPRRTAMDKRRLPVEPVAGGARL